MTLQQLLVRYTAFAVVATAVNLATQRAVLQLGESAAHFTAAMAAGTLAGLVVKYLLDKRWIFFDQHSGLKHQGRTFSLYALMGVATTAVFWITETLFWITWGTDGAREAGAVLGLVIGYTVKYQLDRHFVFTQGAKETE
ncbi:MULTISPECIES: GtrA family protein [unclassified Leisingera]|uniref:GtrA family protein n=1 Tax=unclassified Leisingera TaxID=2614906 RepID=UPI0010118293|nr:MULTISPECIES: GtrA family protein [unclassified Leisingera]MBQ4824995.1 GtrA family protein [Leisingera sp. HS039]QAX29422.1 GtrA family protein [Leisingera sp. NJS204]QBR36181.1 GtrA family protein [Leisingera sp. NJS201]